MSPTQPPSLPSVSDLATLNPTVAVVFIIGGVALAFLAYFGAPIRDMLTRKAKPPPPAASRANAETTATLPAAAPVPSSPAIDRAEQRTDQFIDNLLRQIEEAGGREDVLDRRVEALERQVRDLEADRQRLQTMLWQRGQR